MQRRGNVIHFYARERKAASTLYVGGQFECQLGHGTFQDNVWQSRGRGSTRIITAHGQHTSRSKAGFVRDGHGFRFHIGRSHGIAIKGTAARIGDKADTALLRLDLRLDLIGGSRTGNRRNILRRLQERRTVGVELDHPQVPDCVFVNAAHSARVHRHLTHRLRREDNLHHPVVRTADGFRRPLLGTPRQQQGSRQQTRARCEGNAPAQTGEASKDRATAERLCACLRLHAIHHILLLHFIHYSYRLPPSKQRPKASAKAVISPSHNALYPGCWS